MEGLVESYSLTSLRTKNSNCVSIIMIKHEQHYPLPCSSRQQKCLLDYQVEKGLRYPPPASKVEHKDKIRLTAYKNRVPHRHNSKETDV